MLSVYGTYRDLLEVTKITQYLIDVVVCRSLIGCADIIAFKRRCFWARQCDTLIINFFGKIINFERFELAIYIYSNFLDGIDFLLYTGQYEQIE